jgi:hypothetical protein
MTFDRNSRLISEGFERVRVTDVAIPHTIWKLDLDIEFDRALTLAEETILKLVAAGVGEPDSITQLMGLNDGVIVPGTTANLLIKGLLGHFDSLTITPLGRQALNEQMTRETRKYPEIEVRHEHFSDTFVWRFEATELKAARDVRRSGYHVLPAPPPLAAPGVEARLEEIQSLLDRFGLPTDSDEKKDHVRQQRDIVRLRAVHNYSAWRTAELEIWYCRDRDEWKWLLRQHGGEERAVSDGLHRLELAGEQILPLEARATESEPTQQATVLERAAGRAVASPNAMLIHNEQHRNVLRDAIQDARSELIVISPWLTTSAVDSELETWLDQALQTHKSLNIVIGYGIELDRGRRDRKSDDQRDALKRLNNLGRRHHGRLRTVEIGNTHSKVIICDVRFAVVTSFNFLSFNPKPGQGVRMETGTRVENKETVVALRREIAADLGLK